MEFMGIPIEGLVVLGIVAIFAIPAFIRNMRTAWHGDGTPSYAGPTPTEEDDASSSPKKKAGDDSNRMDYVVGGLLALSWVGATIFLLFFYEDPEMPGWHRPIIVVVLGLLLFGLYRVWTESGGSMTKWLAYAAGLALVISVIIGPENSKAIKDWAWSVETADTGNSSEADAWATKKEPAETPVRLVIAEKDDITSAVRVTRHQCIRAWTDDPHSDEITALIKGANHSEWYTWKSFQAMKEAGTAPFRHPGWWKFKANKENAVVNYVVRDGRNRCT